MQILYYCFVNILYFLLVFSNPSSISPKYYFGKITSGSIPATALCSFYGMLSRSPFISSAFNADLRFFGFILQLYADSLHHFLPLQGINLLPAEDVDLTVNHYLLRSGAFCRDILKAFRRLTIGGSEQT